MTRPASTIVLILVLSGLAGPGCVSREKFIKRSSALIAARDHADMVARAVAAMDPDRVRGEPEVAAKIRSALAERLHGLREVAGARARVTRREFSPGALEVEVSTEVDGVAADGDRVTQQWKDRVRFRFDLETGETTPADWVPETAEESARGKPVYRDRTVEAGLAGTVQHPDFPLESRLVTNVWSGCGATAIDYDRDGWTDIFAGDGLRSILYRNMKGARFVDRTAEAGLPVHLSTGSLVFDYDGDGWVDLLALSNFGPERLFRNKEGRFTEVTRAAGLGKLAKGTSAAAADIDGDGDLDLYLLQSGDYYKGLPPMPSRGRNGYPNVLYRNEGDGTFTDITEDAGVGSTGWGLACAFGDLDDDGDPDLYVANDFGLNEYFENLGGGKFRDATRTAGVSDRGYGMGASLGDFDGDGRLDLYVANIETPYGYVYHDPDLPLPLLGRIFRSRIMPEFDHMTRGNTLFRNLGGGRFEEVSRSRGVWNGGWAWASSFLDIDNDGDLDIYSPNGFAPGVGIDSELDFWIDSVLHWDGYVSGERVFERKGRPLQGQERNRLYRQEPSGAFREIGFVSGSGDGACARGLVIADFDNDGDLDLYLRNYDGRSTYYTYEGEKGHWLQVRLTSDGPNTTGVGARLVLEARGRRQIREGFVGQSYMGGHSPILHFGLGEAVGVERLEIRWPDGTRQTLRDIPADRRIQVRRTAEDRSYVRGDDSRETAAWTPRPRATTAPATQ